MLGFGDRYTDYENSKNTGNWRSISHEGYDGDLMGAKSSANLNQSHYDDVVRYTTALLVQGQKHMLPEYRTKKSINVTGIIDNSTTSATTPADIPSGWQLKGTKIKK